LVFLRTDDADYYAQMLSVFAAGPLFRPCDTPQDLVLLKTDFERDFLSKGIQTLRAAYQSSQS
jgi:hypothetical protein